MSTIHIHLFGKFEVCDGDQAVACFRSQKALELFCFLILFRDQPHHREYLAEMFWGERCTAESKKYLRKTLWQLQSALEQLPAPGVTHLIRTEPDWLQFNRGGEIWLDVLEFESLCASLAGTRGRDFDPQQFQAAQRAAGLYRGDLLEGCYQDWCLFERERLKDIYFILVDKLMGCCEAHQDYEAGILYGRKLLALDGAREGTHLRLMRLYALAGDRTGALRQYEACRDALRQEFEVEPGEKILAIYRQLANSAAGEIDPGSAIVHSQSTPQQSTAKVDAALTRIRELLAQQAIIQEQISAEIQAIEKKMNHNT